MIFRLHGLITLALVVWLALDFQSLFASVFSTYFYFGLKGTTAHTWVMGLVALLTVSGPWVYWSVFSRRELRGELGILLGLQLAAYLLCAFVRHSEVFAWTTVLGRLVSGVAVLSVLRRLRGFSHFGIPVFGILLAFLLHLWARLLNDGLLVAVHPTGPVVALLVSLYLVVLLPRDRPEPVPRVGERAATSLQISAVGFVLLLDLALALLCNVNLWSAQTPDVHASAYLVSFALGATAGLLHGWPSRLRNLHRVISFTAATTGIAFALFIVLQMDYGIGLGLCAHGGGCYGLSVLCSLFIRRLRWGLETRPGALPIAGLQVGSVLGLLAFGLFLNRPDPVSFWVSFGVGVSLMCAVELRRPIAAAGSGAESRSVGRALACCSIFLFTVLPVIRFANREPASVLTMGEHAELTVMTTNCRYGWTDDFRFDPDPYVDWLQNNPATIVGMQEVNKGNFYGGYTDTFEYYRRRIPGHALYGDANFGFGNALFTELEIVDSSVTAFSTSDMIRRSYIWALLKHGGREIEVYVTHLSHLPHPNEIRQAQVAELVERLERTGRPWILMGDMNAMPGDPEIDALAEVAHPVFRNRRELLTEPTYPSVRPAERLDYIFFSEHFDLVNQTVLETRGTTDHRSIRTVLRFAG